MNSLSAASSTLRMQRSLPSLKGIKLPDVELPDMPAIPTVTSVSQGWENVRKRFLGDAAPVRPAPTPLQGPPTAANRGESGSMWNRVLGAIHLPSHDDGYESDRDDYQGESHLTRVMKEYYVAKVSDVSQLPTWLFSPSECSRSTFQAGSIDDQPPIRQQGSLLADVADRPKYNHRRPSDADSGYGSTSSVSSFSSMNRTGTRTSDKLRALRRPTASSGVDSEDDGQPLLRLQGRDYNAPGAPAVRGLPARGAQRLKT